MDVLDRIDNYLNESKQKFWVHFTQNKDKGEWIEATNAKEAKQKFADKEGIKVSSYIQTSKTGPRY